LPGPLQHASVDHHVAADQQADSIRRFRKQNPGASFAVKDVIASALLGLVRSDEVDLGLTGGNVDFPDIEVLFRTSDEIVAVYPDGHPIAKFTRLTAERLAQFPIVMLDARTSVRAVTDQAFRLAKLMPTPGLGGDLYDDGDRHGARRHRHHAPAGFGARDRGRAKLARQAYQRSEFLAAGIADQKKNRTLPPLSKAFADYLSRNHANLSAQDDDHDR